jgi:hypothetical protein
VPHPVVQAREQVRQRRGLYDHLERDAVSEDA